jgi:aspartyl-tRNA synthetase
LKKAFAIAGYDESALEEKSGGMLRALSLGAPSEVTPKQLRELHIRVVKPE